MDSNMSEELLGTVLDAAENASPLEAVEAVTATLARRLRASASFFLIADLSGGALVRMSYGSSDGALERQALGGLEGSATRTEEGEQSVSVPIVGPVETAMRTQTAQVLPAALVDGVDESRGWVVLAPVTERGEALGLLQVALAEVPDESGVAEISRVAHLLAFVVIANRRHTDLFERAERSTLFSLPAEIQRRLLPPAFTCEAAAFTLAAWLEPAASLGGDTFDYSLSRDTLHLSLTDAVGHGVGSALAATLCVGSLRNTRRMGGSLADQASDANFILFQHTDFSGADHFATGLMGRVNLATGTLALVNAGHVAPYLWRGGAVSEVALTPDIPLGMFLETRYRQTELALRPGDRLVLVTDGMLERNAASLDLCDEITRTRTLHPREASRRLTAMVLERCNQVLADDATVMVLDWHGEHGQLRRTSGGAEQRRTSPHRSVRDTLDANG
ncbi:PP2C family protein-serine/threonine phosphatase [Terrabacter terrae]|uniref:PP2C family protein-serine/threonine phosphatase n=1 Tax=Terrabacter terrae TaxID=318434 RepID=A0ABN2TQU6_9MICO